MSRSIAQTVSLGQQTYPLCMSCHGIHGEGIELLGPPLAGSEWVTGPPENLIRMQFRGLMGPIVVKGVEWNGVMMANAPTLKTDERIAAVLTYIRKSWGNEASLITPEQVSKYRHEVGQPMLMAKDLINPFLDTTEEVTETNDSTEPPVVSHTQEVVAYFTKEAPPRSVEGESNQPPMGGLLFGFWVLICLIPVSIGLANRRMN